MTDAPQEPPDGIRLSALDPDFRACPHRTMQGHAMRGGCRYDSALDRYIVSDLAEARAFLRREDVSADPRSLAGAAAPPGVFGATMLQRDPPEHGPLRRLAAPLFTPAALAALRPSVEAEARRLLAAAAAGAAGFDALGDFAMPLACATMATMLAVPDAARPGLGALVRDLETAFDPFADDAARGRLDAAHRALLALFQPRARTDGPADDPVAGMARRAAEDGLAPRTAADTAILLLGAGVMTTSDLIANGLHRLLSAPDRLGALKADRDLIKGAVEEALRLEPPVAQYARTTTTGAVVAGVAIPAGKSVTISAFATGLDGASHDTRMTFDPARARVGHLAFAAGVHACLGSQLARLETEVAWAALLESCPDLRLDPSRPARRRPSFVFNGLVRLDVLR